MAGRHYRIVLLLAAALALAAAAVPGARAETNYYMVDGHGVGGSMVVDVAFIMNEPMSPDRWQGWVLVRETLADCSSAELCDVQPFPAGEDTIRIDDLAAEPNVAYHYALLLVNADGERIVPQDLPYGGPDPTWSGHEDTASIGVALYGVGPVLGYMCPGMGLISRCPDTCWSDFWVEDPDICDHEGEVVAVYGYGLSHGIEGPIINLDHWEPSACPPVPTEPMNWGTLKQRYR